MRSRAFLPLIEQMVMIAVFAIVSAVCIGCFSLASSISTESEYKDDAVILAQNTAESIKQEGGITKKTVHGYTDALTATDIGNAEYLVTVQPVEDNDPLLGSATVCVSRRDRTLYTIKVCWQEGFEHEQ